MAQLKPSICDNSSNPSMSSAPMKKLILKSMESRTPPRQMRKKKSISMTRMEKKT